jgi:drug/metabolite transporter (DMT)-like permease
VPPLAALHTSVFLFGAAGLFGKLLALPPDVIVVGRVVFASVVLGIVVRRAGHSLGQQRREDGPGLVALGVLLAAHWVTFFHAIQLSNVAVGLLTFSTFPVFTAALEPLLLRDERWSWTDLAAAVVTLVGVTLVVPTLEWANAFVRGAFWGTMSGLTFALLSVANRGYVRRYPPLALTFHQTLWAAVALSPLVAWRVASGRVGGVEFGVREVALLALLGIVFTALAHGLFISSLRAVRARVASVAATLEPVYGVTLALLVLREVPAARTVVGGLVILSAAAWVSLGEASA